jgi:ribosomal protein L39E
MGKLLKENIIIPAWDIIKDDTKIKKFYIIP